MLDGDHKTMRNFQLQRDYKNRYANKSLTPEATELIDKLLDPEPSKREEMSVALKKRWFALYVTTSLQGKCYAKSGYNSAGGFYQGGSYWPANDVANLHRISHRGTTSKLTPLWKADTTLQTGGCYILNCNFIQTKHIH